MKKHFVAVETHQGSEIRVVQSDKSLSTWTRKDGGFTVRVDNQRTVRFNKESAPKVLNQSQ